MDQFFADAQITEKKSLHQPNLSLVQKILIVRNVYSSHRFEMILFVKERKYLFVIYGTT